jgi:hypothetical protein
MKKYILSILTILSFTGYALYERQMNPSPQAIDNAPGAAAGNGRPGRAVAVSDFVQQNTQSQSLPVDIPKPTPVIVQPTPTPVKPKPAPTPTPAPVALGKFKDGTYDGDIADVYYGLVQVQAVIRNGKLVDVV